MPVIDDSDEPPAKCCKYCEESTHGVDGPVSWRLTLDQDLIDTLKGSFPSWFQPQTANSLSAKTTINTACHNTSSISKITTTLLTTADTKNIHTTVATTSTTTTTTAASTCNSNSITITASPGLQNGFNLLNNTICVTPITIDTRATYLHAQQQNNLLSNGIKSNTNSNNHTIHLHQLNGAVATTLLSSTSLAVEHFKSIAPASATCSSSASPASSITSNYSAKSNSTISSTKSQPINLSNGKLSLNCKANLKANKHNSSFPPSSSSSYSSSYSSSSSSSSSSSCCSSSATSCASARSTNSIKSSKSQLLAKTYLKAQKNPKAVQTTKSLNSAVITTTETATAASALAPTGNASPLVAIKGGTYIGSDNSSSTHQPIASVGSTTITRVIPKSPSLHSLSGGSLLATFSSPGSATTFEIISDTSCTGLLTSAHLSGKSAFEHSFHDIILLQEAYDDMSEGEQHLNASFLGGSSDDGTNSDFCDPRQSPPKAIVDSSPLQPQMDKNKESLKVKLMVRRPHSQLVEQGIIPPLKTSPAIHEQCKQLERAKTSDLLKAKIQQRPNREDLERRHILEEDECHIDPSLAEKQRMLKKARLADQLNSQIQHRPGPLELIKKNILHTEKPIEKIVKEGLVTFKATSEGLLTRPQHPNSYVTFEDDSQSSESDTRLTPPRLDCQLAATSDSNEVTSSSCATTSCSDVLQAAAHSAGIVSVALSIPTSAGQLMVTSASLGQTKFSSLKPSYIPPPPPPPLPNNFSIKVKQETSNLYEELCQSVTGTAASHYLPLVNSPCSFASSTSTLSPLSSISSPPLSVTPRPAIQSPALQIAKSDAPGKDKNRKKSKPKPTSKARTIKFHEYKGPPSAASKLSSESSASTEETSYQLMLEQQNCLLKFLETLNKNQSIIPATSAASTTPTSSVVSTAGKTSSNVINTVTTAIANSTTAVALATPITLNTTLGQQTEVTSTQTAAAVVAAPRPPPLPSPALSVTSSVPPSPCTSYAESCTSSLPETTKLEKMKVSDLKMHLKKRNLPVSGPKPQLIERLRPYFALDVVENVSAPQPMITSDKVSNNVEAMDQSEINSSKTSQPLEQEQMDVVQQQVDSPKPSSLQTVMPPQPQTATIILSNEELLREQQRKIDELQRQLQRSQQELLEIRQKQQVQVEQHQPQPTTATQTAVTLHKNVIPNPNTFKQQTVTAQLMNAMPTQQITLIATTTNPHSGVANNGSNNKNAGPQTLTLFQQPNLKDISTPAKVTFKTNTNPVKSVVVPVPIVNKKPNHQLQIVGNTNANGSVATTTTTTTTPVMTQKMVVKQHLEAKIQKQKQAQAAAAAAQAQAQAQAHAQAQAQAQAQILAQVQAQALAQAQAQAHLRLLTQKTQTVLIPTGPTITTTTATTSAIATKTKHVTLKANNCTSNPTNAATIVNNQLPLTKTHNNLGLVWNEGNQTIFLVGLNDQHMTAHTIGNISLANASPATKKLLNGHQRTNSLPSIVFPITNATSNQAVTVTAGGNLPGTKSFINPQQLQRTQQQQMVPQQQIIQLDIKPQNLQPPPPPPPPQYEEATKQLKAKQLQQQQTNLLNPLIKIKEEPVTTTSNADSDSTGNENKSLKSSIKAEKLNDVLDILIKQTDLTETALEPITPVATPQASTATTAVHMNDLTNRLLYNQMDDSKDMIKQEDLLAKSHGKQLTLMEMDCGNSSSNNNANLNLNNIYDFYQKGHSEPNSVNNFIENIDMASPLQPECHTDNESVTKTLDMFLDRHQQQQTMHQNSSPTHHDMLSKASACNTTHVPSALHSNNAAEEAKLNHFDEFELLELMSQQLEMDIQEDNSTYQKNQQELNQHSNDKTLCNGLNRPMNTTFSTSLQQLMNSPMLTPTSVHNDSPPSPQTHNILDDFDTDCFVQQLAQQQQQQHQSPHNQTQHHLNAHHKSENINDNNTGNNSNNGSNIINNNNTSSSSSSATTPMDVCDDFDNPLSDFNFSALSPDSNINTPPHPFGMSSSTTTTTSLAVPPASSNLAQHFNGNTLISSGLQAQQQQQQHQQTASCHNPHSHSASSSMPPVAGQNLSNMPTNSLLQHLHSHSHSHHQLQQQQQQCHEQMSICNANSLVGADSGGADGCGGDGGISSIATSHGMIVGDISSNVNDTFGSNSQDIFDLFNIDDYKMSWGEGDFAV